MSAESRSVHLSDPVLSKDVLLANLAESIAGHPSDQLLRALARIFTAHVNDRLEPGYTWIPAMPPSSALPLRLPQRAHPGGDGAPHSPQLRGLPAPHARQQPWLGGGGRTVTSHDVVVNTIGAIITRAGLRVRAERDTSSYPTGERVSQEVMEGLQQRGPADRVRGVAPVSGLQLIGILPDFPSSSGF